MLWAFSVAAAVRDRRVEIGLEGAAVQFIHRSCLLLSSSLAVACRSSGPVSSAGRTRLWLGLTVRSLSCRIARQLGHL